MSQDSDFAFDVFLSHSSKDKPIVRPLAKRLRADGVRVWLDEWEIKPGNSIFSKVEEGLEQSRVLVLCMSANAFGSDWATLESQTFRFRDPLNKERRFIPLRLNNAEIKGSLAQFAYINWQSRKKEYAKLLEACLLQTVPMQVSTKHMKKQVAERVVQLNYERASINAYAFHSDGKHVLTGADDATVQLWDIEEGRCLSVFKGHSGLVSDVAWGSDQRRALSCSSDKTLRIWDVESGLCLRVLASHTSDVTSVVWGSRFILSGSWDFTVRLWDEEKGQCLRIFKGDGGNFWAVALSTDERFALSGGNYFGLQLWDVETGEQVRLLRGHHAPVVSLAWSHDQHQALSGSRDHTLRLWEVKSGRCLHILEGHTGDVNSLTWSTDGRYALSGSDDKTVRLWEIETGRCLCLLEGHSSKVRKVSWSANGRRASTGDEKGEIRVWDLSEFVTETTTTQISASDLAYASNQVQYTNAKVLLVGESGAGKTGLSTVLAGEEWQPSDSTVGAWATQWKLPVSPKDGMEREIWLWDFGGQADQRLIHQLYMDETALAVLVFDGQKDDLFETLGQWDRDLTRASSQEFSKLLVAGRVDAGGLRASRTQVETFLKERGYTKFLETSAKAGLGCADLKQAILDSIRWENIPWRSSPLLFKQLKEEIIRLKDEGRILLRFNELRETLQLRLSGSTRFTDEELKAVVTLLSGPGVVWELKFGSWILLQPERINAYAQAVIQTMRADEKERGCLAEERVLNGDLNYHSSMARLDAEEERFILLAMHETLVKRGLCLRQPTDKGNVLIFPSYYRRERPELVGHPAVLVSYRFHGFLDDIYATLVVRLHHTQSFEQDELWRYAADFKTLTGKQLGVKLTRRAEGAGELEVYFDPQISEDQKIVFSKYVHEHLLQNAKEVMRLRHYVCPHCGTPVGNREVAMKRLNEWLENQKAKEEPTILCVECEKRVPLWDDMERHFASPEVQQRVRELQEESQAELDSESKERVLVGEVISVVALAGQICREKTVSDHGIDAEIEFKNNDNQATGEMVFLQLKSGDSYLRIRKDGKEIFDLPKERHADYWMKQKFPVILVIRSSDGQVRWMEIRNYLKRASDNGKKQVRQIVFEGQRLDVMSVRRWRDAALTKA